MIKEIFALLPKPVRIGLGALIVGGGAIGIEQAIANGYSIGPSLPIEQGIQTLAVPRLIIWRTKQIGVCSDGSPQNETVLVAMFPGTDTVPLAKGDRLVTGSRDNCGVLVR